MSLLSRKSPVPVGTPLPDLSLPDQHGRFHRLRDSAGSPLLLFFYPKDDTPG